MTPTFAPATVATGAGTTTVTLTMTLPGKAGNEQRRGPFGGGTLMAALGLILLPFAGGLGKARSRLLRLGVLAVLGAAVMTGVTGCGGLLSTQSFSFTVTASSGALSHSVTAQLTVK
jgi:hypothetical protein